MDVLSPLMKGLRGALRMGGLRYSESKFPKALQHEPFDYVPRALSDRFTVGFAKACIVPLDFAKKTYYIAGYSENNPAQGILDAPHVHAVWMDDNSGHGGVLLISVDAVGILRYDIERARQRLKHFMLRSGCRSVQIMCTHNHAGIDTMGIWGPLPLTGRKPAYMDYIIERMAECAEKAYANRQKGILYKGTIEVEGMQEDIRLPIVYSKTLTRLRFVPDNGAKETWLLNFASHSESLQGCNSRVSADFPCYLREKIKEETGADVFYCVGAIGGMISMEIPNEREIRDNGGDFAESTRDIGRRLADFALNIKEETVLKPRISVMRRECYFPADNTVLMAASKAGIIKVHEYHLPTAPLRHALKSEVNYMEIDTLKILFIPCELFPELAYGGYLEADESGTGLPPSANPQPLAEILGGDVVFVGLSNDELGYVIPPNDYLLDDKTPYAEIPRDAHGRRHYEETNSLGPETAVVLAEATREIAEAVAKAKGI